MYSYFYLLHFKFLIIGLRIGRERSIGRGVHNFLLNNIKRWQRTTEECAIYAEYTQKKTGLVSKPTSLRLHFWHEKHFARGLAVVSRYRVLCKPKQLSNVTYWRRCKFHLKTARASIWTDLLFNQLNLIFVQVNCDIHDKEKGFREAIEYVKDYWFHGKVEISMIYYIDPRLLIRFVTKHNLNPFNCFYSLKLWRFQLWSIPWIVNRNLEIL